MMNLLAQLLETALRTRPRPFLPDPPPADIGEDLYLRGVAALADGQLDAADGAFRAGIAVGPADYACRVALAGIVILATQSDGIRLVLAEAGAVEVRRIDGFLRIEPAERPIRGRALFAYYSEVILLPAGHPSLAAHTNRWESRCIARLLVGLGYAVDATWFGGPFPSKLDDYDVVFCLHDGLARMADRLSPEACKIMLLTGSSADYQNRREQERLAALAARRGGACATRRQIESVDRELESLALADHCLLQGNSHTRSTYAASLHAKTTLVPVTGAAEASLPTWPGAHVGSRHVLWHFGIGAIHKGLDLAVEVFLRNPAWTLEVVSQPAAKPISSQSTGRRSARPETSGCTGSSSRRRGSSARSFSDASLSSAPPAAKGRRPRVSPAFSMGWCRWSPGIAGWISSRASVR